MKENDAVERRVEVTSKYFSGRSVVRYHYFHAVVRYCKRRQSDVSSFLIIAIPAASAAPGLPFVRPSHHQVFVRGACEVADR